MAKSELRLIALELRRNGKSIKDIALTLGVSKGSVSMWCRDIVLTEQQRENLRQLYISAGLKGRMIGAEMNRQKRLENMQIQAQKARETVQKFTRRDLLMVGIGLYWGEGVKSMNGSTAIVNSDPYIILLARDWFEMLGVTRDRFRPYVFISETHRTREDEIIAFWADRLSIPRHQFNKVVFLKGRPKKVYENHKTYYGICALRVSRGTDLKYHILGLIDACKNKPA